MEIKHGTPQQLADFQKKAWQELAAISQPFCRRAREEYQVELVPTLEEFADKGGREVPYQSGRDERIPGGYRCDLRIWACREGHVLAFGEEGETLSTSTTIAWKPADSFFLPGAPLYLSEDWQEQHLGALWDLLETLGRAGEGTPAPGEDSLLSHRPWWEE